MNYQFIFFIKRNVAIIIFILIHSTFTVAQDFTWIIKAKNIDGFTHYGVSGGMLYEKSLAENHYNYYTQEGNKLKLKEAFKVTSEFKKIGGKYLAIGSKNKKYGLINTKGEFLCPPKYLSLRHPYINEDPYFEAVSEDNKVGIIDMYGEVMIPFTFPDIFAESYENIISLHEHLGTLYDPKVGLGKFYAEGRYILIDKSGRVLYVADKSMRILKSDNEQIFIKLGENLYEYRSEKIVVADTINKMVFEKLELNFRERRFPNAKSAPVNVSAVKFLKNKFDNAMETQQSGLFLFYDKGMVGVVNEKGDIQFSMIGYYSIRHLGGSFFQVEVPKKYKKNGLGGFSEFADSAVGGGSRTAIISINNWDEIVARIK